MKSKAISRIGLLEYSCSGALWLLTRCTIPFNIRSDIPRYIFSKVYILLNVETHYILSPAFQEKRPKYNDLYYFHISSATVYFPVRCLTKMFALCCQTTHLPKTTLKRGLKELPIHFVPLFASELKFPYFRVRCSY